MNKELVRLLLELEYKFDIELYDYFNLTETQRNELTHTLIQFFTPYMYSHPKAKKNLKIAVKIIIDEGVEYEEYEKAEIYTRLLKAVDELTF